MIRRALRFRRLKVIAASSGCRVSKFASRTSPKAVDDVKTPGRDPPTDCMTSPKSGGRRAAFLFFRWLDEPNLALPASLAPAPLSMS